MERHPEYFEEAKSYEKNAVEHGSPFTWSQGESLEEMSRSERVEQIRKEHERRVERSRLRAQANPLRPDSEPLTLTTYTVRPRSVWPVISDGVLSALLLQKARGDLFPCKVEQVFGSLFD